MYIQAALILALVFVHPAAAHLPAGETRVYGDFKIYYATIPTIPEPNSETILAFSILKNNSDVRDVNVNITVYKDNVIINSIERKYATGDLYVPFKFPSNGLYMIVLNAKVEDQSINAVFEQRIETSSINVSDAIWISIILSIIPIYIGIAGSKLFGNRKGFITALALGMSIFLLIDLFEGASGLGMDLSVDILLRFSLFFSFILGMLVPFILTRSNEESNRIAYLFALAVGLHSIAEGIILSYDLETGYYSFKERTFQASSFFLHKIAEGIIISIPLLSKFNKSLIIAGAIGSMPIFVGIIIADYVPNISSSYAFALGAGAATFVTIKLAHSLYQFKGIYIFAGVVLGILFMYSAGLLHVINI